MIVERLMYTLIDRGVIVPVPELRDHNDDVDVFLADVVAALSKSMDKTDTKATFVDEDRRMVFRAIRDAATDEEFLAGARTLAQHLADRMDGRTNEGLLVCLAGRLDGRRIVAVLKLQVIAANGARLERVAGGTLSLTAVKDILDSPTGLQKGMLFDEGAPRQVVVNDKLADNALYFLDAMGVRLHAKKAQTAQRLVDAVEAVAGPEVAHDAAGKLGAVPSGEPDAVFEALRSAGVALTPQQVDAAVGRLRASARPVEFVNTRAKVSVVYDIHGIKVTVPASALSRVEVRAASGGWDLVIHSDVPITESARG